MKKISAVIICKNEEKNIEACIKSVLWCDEIILVDSFSKDNTLSIAKHYTDKIFQNEWKGFSKQRMFALSKVNYEWVFSLDADERCSKELSEEIMSLLTDESIKEKGFEIPRKSFFINKWIKHGGWYPNYQLRLFNKNSVTVSDRLVHEKYQLDEKTNILKNHILHYTVSSISEYVNKVNSYSNLSGLEKANKKKVGLIDILFLPSFAFIQQYIFKGGFLDGIEGLMVSNFHMITKILNYMKIWELQNKSKNEIL